MSKQYDLCDVLAPRLIRFLLEWRHFDTGPLEDEYMPYTLRTCVEGGLIEMWEIRYVVSIICEVCGGAGEVEPNATIKTELDTELIVCPECNGTGFKPGCEPKKQDPQKGSET